MLQAGDIITLEAGGYRLREPLAGSAYGVVWRGQGSRGAPDVALKLINRDQMERAPEALRERWTASALQEIAFLRSLQPWDERHIVRLLDSGVHEGLPVMALELLDGDLANHLAAGKQAGTPPVFATVLDRIAQVNQALAKVHQYGWLYLDLKPANLLVDKRRGTLKLADFGTSRLRAGAAPAFYSGTASWQAPEQFFPSAQGTYATDARTDYFALGAMLYYLATGGLALRFCSECGHAYREHQGGAARALLARHDGAIPPTLGEDEAALFAQRIGAAAAGDDTWCPAGQPSGHGAALTLLRALLAADPAARPQSALQISRMLAAARAQAGPAAQAAAAPCFRRAA